MKPSKRPNHQSSRETQSRFCSNCGFAFPALHRTAQAQFKFCPGCRNPVQWDSQRWSNIRVDDQGVIYADESVTNFQPSEGAMSKCARFLARTPGGVVVSGVALAALGSGFVLAAVPLATAGAVLIGVGATVVQTAVIGGVVMGIVVAYSGDGEALGGVLKLSGLVAIGGGTIVLAGAMLTLIAGIAGVLGTVLIAAGGVAIAAVGCQQLYLLNQKHGWTGRAKTAIAGNRAAQLDSSKTDCLPDSHDPFATLHQMTLSREMIEALLKQKS